MIASARAVEPGATAITHRIGDPTLPARTELTLPPAALVAPRAAHDQTPEVTA
ncbi:hypothetical protein OG799_20640 [Micromonospora sp. NBC_00898]|uniref:hypothetical protein n=1 Tax=Micromonospora sp. NBC_00898 TaxID=2975981 RepID=UPI00386A2123|nr:hypothetical protein OG799_20640 [Micromonospora sp. NBC_00898]